jgi:trans-aconitate methyltransferase
MSSIAQQLQKFVAQNTYPQTVFAKSILNHITTNAPHTLIDAPCGNGETTWRLAHNTKLSVYGFDISTTSITNATNSFAQNNIVFNVLDVHKAVCSKPNNNYTCIINSLFLLPEPQLLVSSAFANLQQGGKLFIIVPNTVGENFLYFKTTSEAHINTLQLAQHQIKPWFAALNIAVTSIESIAYTHHFNRFDTKLLSVLGVFYLNALNYLQTFFKVGKPNYFLITIIKEA